MACLLTGLLLLPAEETADAHDVGISRSDFVVEGRWVHASLVFARGEAGTLVRGGADEDARDVVAKGIAIRADDDACEGALDSAGTVEDDGYAIDATFACTHPPHALVITLYLVDELPRGHRHLARAQESGGPASAQALLDAEHRTLTLIIPTNADAARVSSRWRLFTVFNALLLLASLLAVAGSWVIFTRRRARAARRRLDDRSP